MLKEAVDSVERSMQMLSNEYDEVPVKMGEQDREVKDLGKRVAAIQRQDDEICKLM